jgi:hypothetical protein
MPLRLSIKSLFRILSMGAQQSRVSLTMTEGDTSMVTFQKTSNEHMKPGRTGAHDDSTQRVAEKVGPFVWRLLTMSLAMGSGIALFHLLNLLIRASSSYAALFEPGTDLYAIGMAIFMTVPTWVVAQCGDGNRNTRGRDDCLPATDRLPHLG